jgi:hypothetical protein
VAAFAAKKYRARSQSTTSEPDQYIIEPSTKPGPPSAHPQPTTTDFSMFKSSPVALTKTCDAQVLALTVVNRESRNGSRLSMDFEIHALPSPMQDNQQSFGGHGDLWDEVDKINSQRQHEKRGMP